LARQAAAAPRRSGTQSIERALLILREIAARGRFGWGLRDLAERCGLDRATTHRALAALVRERMVQQRRSDRHYLPGPLIFELSLAMPAYAEFQAAARPAINRLYRRFDTMAALFLRSGSESVCALRAGAPPYVGARLEVGTRGPLVANAGGTAILIALPADERQRIVTQNLRHIAWLGEATLRRLERMLRRSEVLGYAFNQSEVTRGVHSFGVALRGTRTAGDAVFGSIALSGRAEAFPASRAAEVIEALRAEAALLEAAAVRLLPG